ncbi:PilZ domain-containing protein [Paraferrimonas sp. SM1919]|uniref:PilZ domain-containing protein n=1 Tax=Paraferrimonas sp. SM1919 TaxID=2662263 RepID=UPI0013D53EAF|nr:PilZ domain-containing protein [Paraferrimonas sp. SM1919]
MSLEKYHQILVQLVPFAKHREYESIFDRLTAHLDRSARFLIKMEVSRLWRPCIRVIDLRNKLHETCINYQYQGLVHYLDQQALDTFNKYIKLYNGSYTLGVYEAVINNIKQNPRQAIADVTTNDGINILKICDNSKRSEERMNYAVKIDCWQNQQHISGISSDISVNGAKIKLPLNTKIDPNQLIYVKFFDLEYQYIEEELKKGLSYEVVDIEQGTNALMLRLQSHQHSDKVADVLRDFIRRFKFRYKVDTAYALQQAKEEILIDHYVTRISHLPFFVNNTDHLELPFVLRTRDNLPLLKLLSDDLQQVHIEHLFDQETLMLCINQNATKEQLSFYYFTDHQQPYIASIAELNQQGILSEFYEYGRQFDSFMALTLEARPLADLDNASTDKLPPLIQSQISNIKAVLNVTCHHFKEYQPLATLHHHKPQWLEQFKPSSAPLITTKVIEYGFNERRKGSRFKLESQVIVDYGKNKHKALTVDFSTRGFKIKLAKPIEPISLGSTVYLSFPQMNKLTNKYALVELPYSVVNLDSIDKTISVKSKMIDNQHIGNDFFEALIAQNFHHLHRLGEKNDNNQKLSYLLMNLVKSTLDKVPGFIIKENQLLKLDTIVILNQPPSVLLPFFTTATDDASLNLEVILSSNLIHTHLLEKLRAMKDTQAMDFIDIAISHQSQAHKGVQAYFLGNLKLYQKANLLLKLKSLSQIKIIRLHFCRIGKPNIKLIADLLHYIGRHAQHKRNRLEKQLWKNLAMVEISDITSLYLYNLKLEVLLAKQPSIVPS